MANTKHIVSAKWLHDHLSDDDLVILEVSQSKNKTGLSLELSGSICGSILVDIKSDFSEPDGYFPNTFPSVKQFETTCKRLDIRNNSKVIIVDRLGIYSSPRIWFLFRAMGHAKVVVLDGGLPAWISEGYEVVDLLKVPKGKGNYSAQLNRKLIKAIDDITENIKYGNSILIDARSSDRFHGIVPEPRLEIRSGNIPNSINIPFKSLLDGYKYKSVLELQSIFDMQKLDGVPLIFSCGSGVTACVVMLAAELVNTNDKSIYDGSWTEWASNMKE
ncbi:MAG: thiosulfate/3-mercaptopyruvate sulfurtransferase [Saprospiraceae bacterium]